jgi:hypothetical protein
VKEAERAGLSYAFGLRAIHVAVADSRRNR